MRYRHALQAQAMVEFAFAGMIFFTMLFGTIEMGRLLWTNHELANGTREGVRYAMVHGSRNGGPASVDSVRDIVEDTTVGIDGAGLGVSVNWVDNPDEAPYRNTGTADPGDKVIVSTTYTFDFVVGGLLGLDSVTLDHTSEAIVQY